MLFEQKYQKKSKGQDRGAELALSPPNLEAIGDCGTDRDHWLLCLFVLNGESVFRWNQGPCENVNRSLEERHAADAAPFAETLSRPLLLKRLGTAFDLPAIVCIQLPPFSGFCTCRSERALRMLT